VLRHLRLGPTLQRHTPHQLNLVVLEPQLALCEFALAQFDALLLDLGRVRERHDWVRNGSLLERVRRPLRHGRGHETLKVDALGDQSLDAC
jgi:hypothetical protein